MVETGYSLICFHGRWLQVIVRSWDLRVQVVDGKQMIYGKSPGVPVFFLVFDLFIFVFREYLTNNF